MTKTVSEVLHACLNAILLLTSALIVPLASGETKVLCTTFPIYQITRNVTAGRAGLVVDLMLPSQLGCPHDYTLTPQDMRKLADADVLVINGLGMEEFIGAPMDKANRDLVVIDSSAGVHELLGYDGNACKAEHDHNHAADCDHDHGHHHTGINPHLFTSPRLVAVITMNLAAEFAKLDPAGADKYMDNARIYAARMNALASEFSDLGQRLRNHRIVQPHGVMDYLAADIGLEIVAVTQPHGQEPSAAEMLALMKTIRERKPGVIIVEPQYPDKAGRTIAAETGVPLMIFDPAASGPQDAPLDYYEAVMRRNLSKLDTVLGVE